MKLLSISIDNFGKISNFSMNFDSKINVINEENGWGKSTLADFLKVMFYGFDTKKDKAALDKERNLYMPWQGGIYGGELDFEKDGRQYRISRTFGKTEKYDEFHLYDLSTNLECDDFGDKPGESIFDLDSNSFKRSIYIAQNNVLTDASDAINAKLGNLAQNTNDINNYEAALSSLKASCNKLTPLRATGTIKKRENVITQLREELKSYAAAQSAYDKKKELLDALLREKESYKDDKARLSAQLKKASEAEKKETLLLQYKHMCEMRREKESSFLEAAKEFPNGLPDRQQLLDMQLKADELNSLKTGMNNYELSPQELNKLDTLQQIFHENTPDEEELDFIEEKIHILDKYRNDQIMEMLDTNEERELDSLSNVFKSNLLLEPEIRQRISEAANIKSLSDSAHVLDNQRMVKWTLCEQKKQQLDENEGKSASNYKIILGIGVAITVISIVLAIFMLPVGVAGMLLGIITCVYSILKKRNIDMENKKTSLRIQKEGQSLNELQKDIDEINKKINDINSRISNTTENILSFLNLYGYSCDKFSMEGKLYECKGQYNRFLELNKRNSIQRQSQKQQEIDKLSQQLEVFFGAFYTNINQKAYIEWLHQLKSDVEITVNLFNKSQKYRKIKKQYNEIYNNIAEYLKRMMLEPKEPFTTQFSDLLSKYTEYKNAEAALKQADKEIEAFKNQYDVAALAENTSDLPRIEEINEMLGDYDSKIEALQEGQKEYFIQLQDLQEQMDMLDEKKDELSQALELQQNEREQYDLLDTTIQYLERAKEQFTSRYMAPISDGFGKYYNLLCKVTGADNDNSKKMWIVDANLNLRMKDKGEYRDARYLSMGNQDLIGICMRLALVEAMYPKEKPFLVLDDPFVNLDNEKTEHGCEMLKELTNEYQVIYFTCHNSRIPKYY